MKPKTILRKLKAILHAHDANKDEAAQWLRMNPRRFRRLLKQPYVADRSERNAISDLYDIVNADSDTTTEPPRLHEHEDAIDAHDLAESDRLAEDDTGDASTRTEADEAHVRPDDDDTPPAERPGGEQPWPST